MATSSLFFFFYSHWKNNCFVSLHRRSNHPQILEHSISNPKGWKEKFVFIKEDGPSRSWWVRELDERPLFPLYWRKPRYGTFESDWDDLSIEQRLAALRLATQDPLDPKCMLILRCMSSLFLSFFFVSSSFIFSFSKCCAFVTATEASMKDIIGSQRLVKPKKDNEGKKKVSSTKAPPHPPGSCPASATFCEPAVDVFVGSDDVPLIPPSPLLSKFDHILVLNNTLSFEATS